jgi:hypothetical protein
MADAQIKIILEDSGGSGSPGGGGGAPPVPSGGGGGGGGSPNPSRSAGGAARSPSSALFGEFSKLANTTGMGQVTSGIGSAASMAGSISAIGAAGGAVAVLAAGALVAAGSLKLFSMMVASQAKALEPYSAAVSAANAKNDIRQEMMMFRRAGRIGGDIAKFEDMRGQFKDAMSDIWTEVIRVFLDIAETIRPILEEGILILRVIPPAIQMIDAAVRSLIDTLTFDAAGKAAADAEWAQATLKLMKRIAELLAGMAEDELGEDPWIAEFFSIADERRKWDRGRGPALGGAAP